MTLRLLTNDDFDTPFTQLKVVFTGDQLECAEYAAKNGYTLKHAPKLLFGFYWVKENGDCLLPT